MATKKITFDPQLASKIIGIQIKTTEITKILEKLGFVIKKKGAPVRPLIDSLVIHQPTHFFLSIQRLIQ